jgi:hypothetical protein
MACRKVETRGRRLFGLNTELGKQLGLRICGDGW